MKLSNTFTVDRDPSQTWQALQDLEQMALCMPGATLTSVEGDRFTGKVTLRVGPVMMTYTGEGVIEDRDEASRVLTMRLRGKEAKGAGTAAALVRATLAEEAAEQTRVEVVTELDLTGKPAQFGRGVLTDVASVIISKFARNLANQIGAGDETNAQPQPQPAPNRTGHPTADLAESLEDSLDLANVVLLLAKQRRGAVLSAGASALVLLGFVLRRCRVRTRR